MTKKSGTVCMRPIKGYAKTSEGLGVARMGCLYGAIARESQEISSAACEQNVTTTKECAQSVVSVVLVANS